MFSSSIALGTVDHACALLLSIISPVCVPRAHPKADDHHETVAPIKSIVYITLPVNSSYISYLLKKIMTVGVSGLKAGGPTFV